MRAEILALEGKYYETKILVTGDGYDDIICLSCGGYNPSGREIERCGFTREQWESNALVDDGWGGKCTIRQADFPDPGGHYERDKTYRLAMLICDAINNLELPK
jgi:hypothetical protein